MGTVDVDATSGPPDVSSLSDAQRARRARIVDAAIAAMLTTEYGRIQMKDVTAAAGVALGTTYRYFASKDHLLAEALLTWSGRFPAVEPSASTGRSVDHLKKAYRLAVRAFEPHPTAYGTLVVLQASSDPQVASMFERFARRQTAAFAEFIPRIASPRREGVLMVMSAVLDNQLRQWSLGRLPIEDVYTSIDVAADLLLGD